MLPHQPTSQETQLCRAYENIQAMGDLAGARPYYEQALAIGEKVVTELGADSIRGKTDEKIVVLLYREVNKHQYFGKLSFFF